MCMALISPANRARAAASAAAPSASMITIAGVFWSSWPVNAMPAGVAPSRASIQKAPIRGGSSGSSGLSGTAAAPGVAPAPDPPPSAGHDQPESPTGGSGVDIALHLHWDRRQGSASHRQGHAESIRPALEQINTL